MYKLLKKFPDAGIPFVWDGGLVYMRGEKSLVKVDCDLNATIASGQTPFVLEGINGSNVLIRSKEHIMVLDKKNRVMSQYPLLHPTEISLANENTLFLTTMFEQQGRNVLGRYDLWENKFIWERDIFGKHTYYRSVGTLLAVNEAKNLLTCYNVKDGSVRFCRDIYDLQAVIDKRAKHKISDLVVYFYECICLYLESKEDQVLVGLDIETGAERWRIREGLFRSYNQATEETLLSLERYKIIEIDTEGHIVHSIDLWENKPESCIISAPMKFDQRNLYIAAETYDKPGISIWNIDTGEFLGHQSLYEYRDPDEPPVYVKEEENALQLHGIRMYVVDNENTLYVFEEEDPDGLRFRDANG
jgi:hypothetical protein